MPLPTHFELKDGNNIPSVGFGTWASGDNSWCKQATLEALRVGYRHLDGAWHYGVDRQIGDAIRESGIPREELWVTTKFYPHFHRPENVSKSLEWTLKEAGLDYVDLYMMHWPVAFQSQGDLSKVDPSDPNKTPASVGIVVHENTGCPVLEKLDVVATWRALEALVDAGKVKSIGVSNFSPKLLDELLPHARIPVAVNQIEAHPWLPNTKIVEYCRKHDILVQAYSPFAGQNATGETLIRDPTVVSLAQKNGMGVGALLTSWAVQRGTNPLGKSSTPERIRSNLLEIKTLSEDDVRILDALERSPKEGRTIDMSKDWGVKLFEED